MKTRHLRHLLVVAALLLGACGGGDDDDGGAAPAEDASTTTVEAPTGTPIKLGVICDRSGPLQIIGVNLCPGFADYIDLVNTTQGGVDGHPIEVIDIDHAYEVPKGVAAYDQMREQGAVAVFCFGTAVALALNDAVNRDEVPCLTPGFGIAQAGDPSAYPYQFPIAASYLSQGAAAVEYALENTDAERPKIAYLYYDNPSGQEPVPILEALAERDDFELKTFAVPAPGIEMAAQVTDITQRYKADFVISHLFGKAPAVSIKALKEAGYPLDQVISLVWGAAEADIEAAGGFAFADGYATLQFADVGQDSDTIKSLIKMFEDRGDEVPAALTDSSVYYNRGAFSAAVVVEALRKALAQGADPMTGKALKAGLESLSGFDAGGLAPPLNISATDHEGGGYTRVYQVKGGKLQPLGDWDNHDHELVLDLISGG
jgi:branched-chain amino acid transport system substrate-binding protein